MLHSNIWSNKRVLVTGHTGFKGGWLTLWLHQMGAKVHGMALAPNTDPALFDATQINEVVQSNIIDIRDAAAVRKAIAQTSPEVVFHLAAQPLVRRSYEEPLDTIATNVMGSTNLLDACRDLPELEAFICVTTDKVYENHEWVWPYRETDQLGGKDPYSASKSAAELITKAYRHSFFDAAGVPVLTARGGNVIGGGDWADDRLIPDLMRARLKKEALEIRAPNSVRPWQHVLVLCHGYLALAEHAIARGTEVEGAWNFGPLDADCVSVSKMLKRFQEAGLQFDVDVRPTTDKPESKFLALDSSMARRELGWQPALELPEAVAWTAQWYRASEEGQSLRDVTNTQIRTYAARICV